MKINKLFLFIVIYFGFFNQVGIACECLKTQPFLNNISKNTRIVRVKIIEHGLLPKSEIRKYLTKDKYPSESTQKNIPLVPFEFETYSKLRVIDNYLGRESIDTILFLNGSKGACRASLEYSKIGSEHIIRYEIGDTISTIAKDIINQRLNIKYNDRINYINASDCINWELKIESNYIIGNIVTSREAMALLRLHNNIDTINYAKKIEEIRNFELDKWSIEDFESKLDEIKNTLYNK